MVPKLWVLLAMLSTCLSLGLARGASAAENLALHANFDPDQLGAPTNLTVTATFASQTPGPLSPTTMVTAYGPAGMSVDVRGAATCTATAALLEADGPGVCPVDSRVGFGKATGLTEWAGELIPSPFTLEFFLAPSEDGHLAMLIYVSAVTPATEQVVLTAKEVRAPKPYGVGLSFAIPIIPTLPGATLGWVQHALLTLGSSHGAFYKTAHGKQQLVHVKGIVAPKTCPGGGFPMEVIAEFADHTTSSAKTAIPCPRGS